MHRLLASLYVWRFVSGLLLFALYTLLSAFAKLKSKARNVVTTFEARIKTTDLEMHRAISNLKTHLHL